MLRENLPHAQDEQLLDLFLVKEADAAGSAKASEDLLLGRNVAHEQDRGVLDLLVFLNLLDDIEAGHQGQHHGKQDQVRALLLDQTDRLRAVLRLDNVIVSCPQEVGREGAHPLITIGHQDLLLMLGLCGGQGASLVAVSAGQIHPQRDEINEG